MTLHLDQAGRDVAGRLEEAVRAAITNPEWASNMSKALEGTRREVQSVRTVVQASTQKLDAVATTLAVSVDDIARQLDEIQGTTRTIAARLDATNVALDVFDARLRDMLGAIQTLAERERRPWYRRLLGRG